MQGVCFDTGGLNLKPTGSIENMHMDKGGAAAVLAAAHIVGQLRPKANVGASRVVVKFLIERVTVCGEVSE
jgi:leucyl aminopeptidase